MVMNTYKVLPMSFRCRRLTSAQALVLVWQSSTPRASVTASAVQSAQENPSCDVRGSFSPDMPL